MASSLVLIAVLCCHFALIFASEFSIDCKTLVPVGNKESEVSSLSADPEYKIKVANTSSPGGALTVKIEGRFRRFMIQARQPAMTTPIGSWSGPSTAQIRTCGQKDDTATETSGDTLKNDITLTWTAPKTANNGVLNMIATVVNHDGKFFQIQSNLITEVQTPRVAATTTALPDTEEEEGSRPTDGEKEEPAKPQERPLPKNTEQPNAFEIEQERQRQESLRRDREGGKPAKKVDSNKSENESTKETTRRRDEEAEETAARHSALEEEEQEEIESRRRAEAEAEEDRPYNTESEDQEAEESRKEQMRVEVRQMEEQMAKEEEERLKRIKWEEDDAKQYLKRLQMEKQREKEFKKQLEKNFKIPSDEVLVDDDKNVVMDEGDSGASQMFASIATMTILVVGAFYL